MVGKFAPDSALRKSNFGNKRAPLWQPGQSGNPRGIQGKSARSTLSQQFLRDLRRVWDKHGIRALEACATEDPSGFVRTVASLMPRHVDLSVGVDPVQFVTTFRQAIELLGNEPPMLLRRAKVIEGEVVDADRD
jgi:hypothetical protein